MKRGTWGTSIELDGPWFPVRYVKLPEGNDLYIPAYFLMRIDVNGGIHELDYIVVSNQT